MNVCSIIHRKHRPWLILLVGVVIVLLTRTTRTSSSLIPRRLESTRFPLKILYVVTTGGQSYDANDRIQQRLGPVVMETVTSLLRDDFATVDVYLVVGSPWLPSQDEWMRQLLPPGVGLEVWSDALPLSYHCEKWKYNKQNASSDALGVGDQCGESRKERKSSGGFFNRSRIERGNAQLARQHRFVIKDKLPYYDFFLVFEDDMILHQQHVQQHQKWMARIRAQIQRQSSSLPRFPSTSDWKSAIPLQNLERLRPGFVRVEVLQPNQEGTKVNPFPDTPETARPVHLQPQHCCHTQHLPNELPNITQDELMIWETGALGMTVRPMSLGPSKNQTEWMALLLGNGIKGIWPGQLLSPQPPQPDANAATYLAQSAGWMSTPQEVMDMHTKYCDGGFLPPYNFPRYPQDGLHRKNVEYWSGGIQLWCGTCQLRRFIPLTDEQGQDDGGDEFSKHLIYHSSNNKQFAKPKERLVLAKDLYQQLHQTRRFAENLLNG